MENKYNIYRFYADGRGSKVLDKGLTLEQAQAHCTDDETSSSTATGGEGNVGCAWFDGYEAQ